VFLTHKQINYIIKIAYIYGIWTFWMENLISNIKEKATFLFSK
jgi:hypothetical protein